MFFSLKRKYFFAISTKQYPTGNQAIYWWTVPELQCKTSETVASDRKSGNSLMDGAGIAVQNNRNRGVRQEIRQFTDGRCRNCSAKLQKQGRPTGNQAIHWWTVPELQCKTSETVASDRKSGNSLMDCVEKLPVSRILTGLQSWIFSHFHVLFRDFTKFIFERLSYDIMDTEYPHYTGWPWIWHMKKSTEEIQCFCSRKYRNVEPVEWFP